jgi:hypothetical protein
MKIILPRLLIALALLSFGCSNQQQSKPVVIHVLRDPSGIELESVLLTVSAKQLSSVRGAPIMIATLEPRTYTEGLESLGHEHHPELVIFSSIKDGEKAHVEVAPQAAVRVANRQYYLVIPAWVSGEQRQDTEIVVAEIRRELEETGKRASGTDARP